MEKNVSLEQSALRQQIPLTPLTIPIQEIVSNPKRYTRVIQAQRGNNAWPLWKKQLWTDTLLNGLPVPSVMYACSADNTELNLEDGQQRITAIIGFFNNVFPTISEESADYKRHGNMRRISAPEMFFRALKTEYQRAFLQYKLPAVMHPQLPDKEEESELYRRLQLGESLTAAEIHITHNTKGASSSRLFAKHCYWQDFFVGKDARGIIAEYSYWFVLIELSSTGICNLSRYARDVIAQGLKDNTMSTDFVPTGLHAMDNMCIIFQGITFADPRISIIMYQAAYFLRKLGVSLDSQTHRGVLTDWLKGIMIEHSRMRILSKIEQKKEQVFFWQREWENILSVLRKYSLNYTAACPGLE